MRRCTGKTFASDITIRRTATVVDDIQFPVLYQSMSPVYESSPQNTVDLSDLPLFMIKNYINFSIINTKWQVESFKCKHKNDS